MQSFRIQTQIRMESPSRSLLVIKARITMMGLVFIGIFFFLETSPLVTAAATDDINPLVELSRRKDLVNIAGYGEDKLSTVTVSGKVLCHACMGGKIPVPTHPVSGASVAVFCGSSGKSKKSWARGTADEYGDFYIDLPSHLHAIPNLEKVCMVKVLQLPKSSLCRRAFTGKHKDLKLVSIGDGARAYTAHDILLMPRALEGRKRRGAN